jgi:hypothetical protein
LGREKGREKRENQVANELFPFLFQGKEKPRRTGAYQFVAANKKVKYLE